MGAEIKGRDGKHVAANCEILQETAYGWLKKLKEDLEEGAVPKQRGEKRHGKVKFRLVERLIWEAIPQVTNAMCARFCNRVLQLHPACIREEDLPV